MNLISSHASVFFIKIDGRIIEVMSSFGYFCGSFSKDEGPRDDVKVRRCEGLKVLGAMKGMCPVKGVKIGVERFFF